MFIFVWTVGKSVFIAVYIIVFCEWLTVFLCDGRSCCAFTSLIFIPPTQSWLWFESCIYTVCPSIHPYQCLCSHTKQPLCITSETLRTSDGNNSHKCLIGYKNTFNHFSTQKLKNRKFQILLDTL